MLSTGSKITLPRKGVSAISFLSKKISLTIKFEWGFAHISSRYMQTRVIISKILLAGAFALMQALPVAMQNIRIACRQLSGEVPLAKLCLGWWLRLSISSVTIGWLVPVLLFRNHDDVQRQSLLFFEKASACCKLWRVDNRNFYDHVFVLES